MADTTTASRAAGDQIGAGQEPQGRARPTRIAINLLTEDPGAPSGAHWFWTRVIPEMAKRLRPDEELHLIVSPKSRPLYSGFGEGVHYITFPWSNEKRWPRTLSEHLYSPLRLPLSHIDVLNTLMAPLVNPTWSLVIHIKTVHAYTSPGAIPLATRAYRQMSYPRSLRLADAVIINSESLRADLDKYLQVDHSKLRLVYEAVDHDLFAPRPREAAVASAADHGITKPFVLFVSSLWPYKNCHGLLKAWAKVKDQMAGRQLAIVGGGKDSAYQAELRSLVSQLGIGESVVFVGPVPLEQTAVFYNAADALVYPSFSETFGLPLLEAMACGCPVVTSDISAMPEIAGGAALLADPNEPEAIGRAMVEAVGPASSTLRDKGFARASQFTWSSTAAATLDVYREVAEKRRHRERTR